MKAPMSKISIILLNYNSSDYTINCVNSIIEQTFDIDYEIIIVDNNSLDTDFIKLGSLKKYDFIKIIRSRINSGFSAGNMLGIQNSCHKSQYYFFLNNDCLLLNNVCLILYDYMNGKDGIGISTPQTYNEDMSFEPSFGYFPDLSLKLFSSSVLRAFNKAKYLRQKKIYNKPVQVPVVTGSAMFIRASVFNKLGGFDTNYFFYCEEEDLCKRLNLNGFKAFLVPAAKFIHFGGRSTIKSSAVTKEYYISLFYYYRKFSPFWARPILKFVLFFENIINFYKSKDLIKVAFFILKGAPSKYSLRHQQSIKM